MPDNGQSALESKRGLTKIPTGIQGLDDITGGGVPAGRPTLLCGGPGSGKTLMAMAFIVRGITLYDENGVYLTFEETKDDLYNNVASFGFNLDQLDSEGRIVVREIDLEVQDAVEVGDYNLEGLFVQIGFAIDSVKAKRVVIDGIESLFSYFSKENILRKELKRLFRWLKNKNVTAIITSERGDSTHRITRQGIEEYLSDCVILLDHRIDDQIATRRLNVLKYRGSRHGTNEYPFLITDKGISVFPITSLNLDHDAPLKRLSTGIETLNNMFGGEGYYKGSSVLVTGTAGTGKTSLAACFAKAICRSGEKCIYFAFEESPMQIIRNMNAIGLNLKPYVDQGLLKIHSARPMLQGLEMHLLMMHDIIEQEKPTAVILDPITNLEAIGKTQDIRLMFVRTIDYLKKNEITGFFTALTPGDGLPEATEVGVSSLMDTWIALRNEQTNKQRRRTLFIVKSRGTGHSNKMHAFEITGNGFDIKNPK